MPGQLVYVQSSGIEGDVRSAFTAGLVVAVRRPYGSNGCDLYVTVLSQEGLRRCCDCGLFIEGVQGHS